MQFSSQTIEVGSTGAYSTADGISTPFSITHADKVVKGAIGTELSYDDYFIEYEAHENNDALGDIGDVVYAYYQNYQDAPASVFSDPYVKEHFTDAIFIEYEQVDGSVMRTVYSLEEDYFIA